MHSSGWAPLYFLLKKGPSKWTPKICAPSTLSLFIETFSIAFLISSTGIVIVVGKKDVTPVFKVALEIVFKSSKVGYIVSLPPRPCVWTSTKPGET